MGGGSLPGTSVFNDSLGSLCLIFAMEQICNGTFCQHPGTPFRWRPECGSVGRGPGTETPSFNRFCSSRHPSPNNNDSAPEKVESFLNLRHAVAGVPG